MLEPVPTTEKIEPITHEQFIRICRLNKRYLKEIIPGRQEEELREEINTFKQKSNLANKDVLEYVMNILLSYLEADTIKDKFSDNEKRRQWRRDREVQHPGFEQYYVKNKLRRMSIGKVCFAIQTCHHSSLGDKRKDIYKIPQVLFEEANVISESIKEKEPKVRIDPTAKKIHMTSKDPLEENPNLIFQAAKQTDALARNIIKSITSQAIK